MREIVAKQSEIIIEPLGDRVYIELEPMQDRTKSIMLPDDHHERTRVATVRAIGPDLMRKEDIYGKYRPWWKFWRKKVKHFRVGDTVLVSYYTGTILHLLQYALTGINYRIARESEIMARVKGEA
jgi:co-chaperonin GroES (HSP10)